MKSIIIVSTFLFVTASFMGIGNYIRYHDELRGKGLYQSSKTENSADNTVQASGISAMPAKDLPDLPDQQQEVSQQQAPSDTHSVASAPPEGDHSALYTRQHKSKKRSDNAVTEPVDREINLRSFSRAPLDDDPPVYNTDEEAQQNTPVIISDKEANE
jgi:hypothetical protein